MRTEAQKRADKKYRQTKEKDMKKTLRVDLRYATDSDILEHLEKQGNVAGYVKALIRADIAKGGEK